MFDEQIDSINFIYRTFLRAAIFFFIWTRSFNFGEVSQIMNLLLTLFASLQLNWVTIMGILLGPAMCLSHEDGGISLSVLPKDTTS